MAFDLKNILDKADDNTDFKEFVEKAVDRLKEDDNLLENFKENPVKVIENILNVDLPDDVLEKIADTVKAKINIDDAKNMFGKIGSLFDKD